VSTLAEIEQAVETLPRRDQEELMRFLSQRIQLPAQERRAYQTRTHPGGFKPGFDAAKLGQLPEEF